MAAMIDRLAQLTKLHQADPTDPFCTYGIALEHAKAGDHEKALTWLDKTLRIDPHYGYAYYQKGKILSEMGREEQARELLRQGIATARQAGGPDNLHAAQEMGDLLESIG